MTKPQSEQQNQLLGIGLKVSSVCAFMGMATCIKLAGQLPVGQIAFFRSFWAVVPIVIYLLVTNQFKGIFKTKSIGSHIMRSAIGVVGMGLGFYSLTRLPLPDAVALGYSGPLLVIVISAVALGEVVRKYRWGAVIIGFIGVMIISWPKLQVLRGHGGFGNQEAIGVLAAFGQAFVGSIAFVLVRKLTKTEKTLTIVLYFSIIATLFSLLTIPFGWAALSGIQIALLIASGFFGGLGQVTLTQSYRFADMSTIAPFEYTSVLLSLGLGYWLFSDIPTWSTLIGSAIVVGAGIFIIYRERALGLERSAARKSTNLQGL